MRAPQSSTKPIAPVEQLLRTLLAATVVASSAGSCLAAFAKSQGQPISAYSASLFGKKGLTAKQTQVLTCDPNEPLFGSTSASFDIDVVRVTGFGFGPGYMRWAEAPAKFPSGAAIELLVVPVILDSAGGEAQAAADERVALMADLQAYIKGEVAGTPTGYLQLYYQLNDVRNVGKLTPDGFQFLGSNAAIPGGVDTHYFEFEYLDGVSDARAASYLVFDDLGTRPGLNTLDFMASAGEQGVETTRPGEVLDAAIAGTVPEPGAVLLVAAAAAVFVGSRRRGR